MKYINLTKGYRAMVDNEDFGYLNQFNWYASVCKYTVYAITKINGHTVHMHRLIMGTPKGLDVDHIDHDGLNNQKINLRNCTRQQNQHNQIKHRGISKYLGVSYAKDRKNKWRSQIKHNNKKIALGSFATQEEAMLAYNKKSKELYGE
jgi:hypothetical protein